RRLGDVFQRGEAVARRVDDAIDLLRDTAGRAAQGPALARDVVAERAHLVEVGVPERLLQRRELEILVQLVRGDLEHVAARLAAAFLRAALVAALVHAAAAAAAAHLGRRRTGRSREEKCECGAFI